MSLLIDPEELTAELAAIEAESIGWLPLSDGAYLHLGKPDEEEMVITVTGVPDCTAAKLQNPPFQATKLSFFESSVAPKRRDFSS